MLPLEDNDLENALREQEFKRMSAMDQAGKALPVDEADSKQFQMVLKRKRMAGILQAALKDAGYGDLSKMIRFKEVSEEK